MKTIALRCSNSDFAYVVLDGTQEKPSIEQCANTAFPKGYEEHSLLYWFYQEITEIMQTHSPDQLVIKAAETMVKRSNSLELRMRIEGIALMVAAEVGCASACRKVKSTIAKDLGMKGKGKYLETKLDTTIISSFDSYKAKQQEAILAGWSCLD